MEYQSIEYNKIIHVYYGSNCYNCFAMHMSIDNNLQEYGILPHSRTYYCLLFSLYHMFIVIVISY